MMVRLLVMVVLQGINLAGWVCLRVGITGCLVKVGIMASIY